MMEETFVLAVEVKKEALTHRGQTLPARLDAERKRLSDLQAIMDHEKKDILDLKAQLLNHITTRSLGTKRAGR